MPKLVLMGLLMILRTADVEETDNVLVVANAVSIEILEKFKVEDAIALLDIVIEYTHAERCCFKLVVSLKGSFHGKAYNQAFSATSCKARQALGCYCCIPKTRESIYWARSAIRISTKATSSTPEIFGV